MNDDDLELWELEPEPSDDGLWVYGLNLEPDELITELEPSADYITDLQDEIDAVRDSFVARARRDADRLNLATDAGYTLHVVFRSSSQAAQFANRAGWDAPVGIVNGETLATRYGIELDPVGEIATQFTGWFTAPTDDIGTVGLTPWWEEEGHTK
jgi:hypothetical protein